LKRPDSPSLREALRGVRSELDAAGVESPDVEAERLVAHVTGFARTRLALEGGTPLPAGSAAELARLVARRTAGEPLQHLEGTVEFRGLVLKSDARALIPRPETEQLIDLIERALRPAARAGVRTVARPVGAALDIGTGSGAIALSLVAEGLVRRVVALDVSEGALSQARENRSLCGVAEDRLELRPTGADPFEALEAAESFDLIVSNPPYVLDADVETLPREVRDHEPRAALAGGADGLDLVRMIAARGPDHLVRGGRLFLELGADQGAAASALFEAGRGWEDVARHLDLSGRDRFLTARRA